MVLGKLVDDLGCDAGEAVSDVAAMSARNSVCAALSEMARNRSMNFFQHIISLIRLILIFRQEKFDVVHVHTPVAALIGRIASRINRVPLIVYTAHGFYFHEGMSLWKQRVFIGLEKFAGLFTDLLFTQSAEDAATAVDEKICSKKKIYAIGNGVDVELFNPQLKKDRSQIKKTLGIPNDAIVIGMVGRLVEEKGVIEFLEAAEMIAQTNENVWFLLVGERLESDHSASVDGKITKTQSLLGRKMVLTGLRQDIPNLLAIMDCFCLPSWREGMPRTIIEAMMMGIPVVATNIRGSREEVVHEKTGLLVPVGSPGDLTSAINRCLQHPKWTRKMGNEGRKRALALYDERQIVNFQISIILSHINKKGHYYDGP